MVRGMRLIFFGSGEFGLPTLQALSTAHEVVGVVTQPDRPAGRSRKPTPTPVADWAAANLPGAVVLKPEDVNEQGIVERIRSSPADAFVVIAFGQKLGRALLAERFAINLHASLLPRWRGAAPINHAILAGDRETGNSVITVAEQMDAGDILAQSRRAIEPDMTAGDLHDLLAADGPALVLDVLGRHEAGTLTPVPQNPSLATLAPKLSKRDGWVDFRANAEECRRRIHGLSPRPGVAVRFRDESVRLLRARVCTDAEAESSKSQTHSVGVFLDPRGGIVACGSGTSLRLVEVQPAGGRAMPWADFARGRRVLADERLVGGAPC